MIGILDMRYVGTYNDTDGYEHIRPKLVGDTISDRPSAIIFQQRYKLEIGTTFHCISDGTDWEMKSDATWVQFIDSYLTNTYTKQEIDDFVSGLNTRIDDVEDEQSNQLDYIRRFVDEGAKNLFRTSATTQTITDVTFTNNNDGTWAVNGTAAGRRQKALAFTVPTTLESGTYALSGCPSGGAVGTNILYCLYLWDVTANVRISTNDVGNGVEFGWSPDSTHQYQIVVDIRGGTTADNLIFRPMICTQADWNISEKFVPYTPTLHELYEMVRGYHP